MPKPSGTPSAGNPFPGPKPYGRGEDAFFFGRQDEIEELTTLVLSTSAIVLDAPSGTGKSSLINAGLLPNLKKQHFESIVHIQFGNPASLMLPDIETEAAGGPLNPFSEIVGSAIRNETAAEGDDLVSVMASLGRLSKNLHLLVLDQFEEIFFNFPQHWAARSPFFHDLECGLEDNPNLRALIAIRSDYLASLLPYQRQLPGELVVRYSLESLREGPARETVAQAFAATGRPLNDAALDDLVTKLLTTRPGGGGPPFKGEFVNLIQLQVVCQRLWESHAGHPQSGNEQAVALESSVSYIDVETAMDEFVDGAITNVVTATPADESSLRGWLQSDFITPEGHRNLLRLGDQPDAVVEQLDLVRLVSVTQRNQDRWVELTHDSMVAAVQRSNNRWRRGQVRRRHLFQVGLVVIVLALIGFLPALRNPPSQCDPGFQACRSGSSGSGTLASATLGSEITVVFGAIRISALPNKPDPSPTLILSFDGSETKTAFAPSDPTGRTSGSDAPIFAFLSNGFFFSGGAEPGRVLTAGIAIPPGHQRSYLAKIDWGAEASGPWVLAAASAPLVRPAPGVGLEKPGGKKASTQSPFFGIKVPSSPFVVRFPDANQQYAVLFGAMSWEVLARDTTLIQPGSNDTYVLVGGSGRDVAVDGFPEPVADSAPKTSFEHPGALATLRIPAGAPRAQSVDVVCDNNPDIDVTILDPDFHKVTATLQADTSHDRASPGVYLAASLAPGEYRLVVVAPRGTKWLSCQVQLNELSNLGVVKPDVGPLTVKTPIDPSSGHAGYRLASIVDSVVVIDAPPDLHAALSCGTIPLTPSQLLPGVFPGQFPAGFPALPEPSAGQTVAFLPAGQICLLVVDRGKVGATGAATLRMVPLPSRPSATSRP